MEMVIIESPFAGNEENSTETHVTYARRAMKDALLRGEAPYASHLLYTQEGVLDDTVPAESEMGIMAGLFIGDMASKTVVYADYGMSRGMEYGIQRANDAGRPIEYREIGKN